MLVLPPLGSAYGGGWKPKKKADERFLGKPGTTNVTTNSKGAKYFTTIGPDGKAVSEEHCTDHGTPAAHANPHTHPVHWDPQTGVPTLGSGVPSAEYSPTKGLKGVHHMGLFINASDPDDNRFETLYEFTDALHRGGEIQFLWNGCEYAVSPFGDRFAICESGISETICWYETTDDLLDHMIDGEKLRSIIKRAVITERTL